VSDRAERHDAQPLGNALLTGAVLLVVYSAITLPFDWSFLLDAHRPPLTSGQALDQLLELRRQPAQEGELRLIVLAGSIATTLVGALLLALPSMLPRGWQAALSQPGLAVAAIALVCMGLSVPAHLPFVLPHVESLRADGSVLTQAEYSRAYRDAITYVWSSILLLAIPVVASGRTNVRIKVGTAVFALLAVSSAYLPHLAHKGSRTDNEIIIFAVALATVLYLGHRAQRALQAVQAERTRYEEQSQAALRELAASERRLAAREIQRAAFLASAAHDLRHPLAAAMLYGDLLAQALQAPRTDHVDADVARYMKVLKAEITSLAAAFDAILDYSQIESGGIATQVQSHRLRDVFAELERRFELQARGRQLSLRFMMPPDGCIVKTDAVLLGRLLSNVLSNAIKCTSPRTKQRGLGHDIVVRARSRGLLVTVYVMDCGRGIPPEMQEKIFEPGVQLDNPHRDRHEGFGLGLATVRSIVTHALTTHSVRVKSIVGRGTHLMLDVPLDLAAGPLVEEFDATLAPGSSLRLEGALVAVVEDDDSLRGGLVEVLKRAGAFVMPAGTLEAITAELAAADRFPDIILTDYRLPGGATGEAVIETIRRACGGREVPAIVLTADHRTAEQVLARLANVEVVRKPVDRKALLLRLSSHYASAPSPLDTLASSSATPARAIS
jgi:signal transduction histidine kinase/FixJ family two-component response regulator